MARIAAGPVMPGWGSWEWVGADLLDPCSWTPFRLDESPLRCDLLLVIKHVPPPAWLAAVPPATRVVFAPIDRYGSPEEILQEAWFLRRCALVVIHCEQLRAYFAPHAPVEYVDHHVKFVTPGLVTPNPDGPILWTGVMSNLQPLVEWTRQNKLPAPLLVLSNFGGAVPLCPHELGFPAGMPVSVRDWSPQRHVDALAQARAALDVKGKDFRSQHKPPAKALDFLASGLPLAINTDSSPAEHLARRGFDVVSPDHPERWLSPDYATECRRFGASVREHLSLQRVAERWRGLLGRVLASNHYLVFN